MITIVEIDKDLEREIYQGEHVHCTRGEQLFNAWCKEHNVYYYGRPEEKFDPLEGYELAEADRANALILEKF